MSDPSSPVSSGGLSDTEAAPSRVEVSPGDANSLFTRLFSIYVRRFMGKSFHGVRVLRASFPVDRLAASPAPLVVYLNHPSWWDPLTAMLLAQRYFPERRHVAMMEAEAASRYRIFERLGFVGIESGTLSGARRFLAVADALFREDHGLLWLTPHGRFVDTRVRSAPFASGVARLARRVPDVTFLPLALEYPFWDERFPEALACFGTPRRFAPDAGREAVTEELEGALESTQEVLARAALRRDPGEFESLLEGRVGVGGVYDGWRRLRAAWRGESFQAAHAEPGPPVQEAREAGSDRIGLPAEAEPQAGTGRVVEGQS